MMMLLWLVVLAAILWVVWMALARQGGFGRGPGGRPDGAETLLRARYARGEIDEATYRRMLEELRRP